MSFFAVDSNDSTESDEPPSETPGQRRGNTRLPGDGRDLGTQARKLRRNQHGTLSGGAASRPQQRLLLLRAAPDGAFPLIGQAASTRA